jgi:hypothetical protein
LGGLLLGVMEGAFGHKALQQLAKPLDWLSLEQDVAIIDLTRCPALQQWLDYPLLGKPLAARLTIRPSRPAPACCASALPRPRTSRLKNTCDTWPYKKPRRGGVFRVRVKSISP